MKYIIKTNKGYFEGFMEWDLVSKNVFGINKDKAYVYNSYTEASFDANKMKCNNLIVEIIKIK